MERPEFAQHDALPIDSESLQALTQYLRGRLPGMQSALRLQKFAGGQSNPTYKLECGERTFVLRKKPTGTLLPTAHMIEREYRVFEALTASDVPVPKVCLYCNDSSVIGSEFFVMEYVTGRIFWDPTLPQLTASERPAIYREMARVLAALHRVDYAAVGLSDYGKAGNYFARQIKRWSQQYEAARTEALPAMDDLMRWLPDNIPADDSTTLVHGDFRLDNMIFHPSEPRILAVLDWELSTLGHPLADLAYNCIPYHLAAPGREPLVHAAQSGSGIPTEAEYVAEYCRASGRSNSVNLRFHLAFSLFRSASILQGVYKRGLLGNASSGAEAVSYRERVLHAAETAWALVR
jgi:aminoglycoside phosphotransferase (APT) family kinase protein